MPEGEGDTMKESVARRFRQLPRATTCALTGKKRWPDHKSAVQILHRASVRRDQAIEFGAETRRAEIRTYSCDACGGWHTTSREYMALSA